MVHTEFQRDVAVVKLDRGVSNPLNLELVTELAGIVRGLKRDSRVRGLVLTSANNRFFSIGFDIPHLFNLGRDDFEEFYRAFNRLCLDLYTMPGPTAAAVTGHAIAGGCILTLCCDYRYAAEGRKLMGLNEVKLGVPVPYPADCILRRLVGPAFARDIMEEGEFYTIDQAHRMGMVDRVLPAGHVVREAIEKVGALCRMPGNGLSVIKRNRVETVEKQVLELLEEKEQRFLDCWYSDEARLRLKEAMEKF